MSWMRALRAIMAALISCLLMASCASEPPTPTRSASAQSTPTQSTPTQSTPIQPTATQPAPWGRVSQVASGLEAPWSITFLDGAALVSERDSGRIMELSADGTPRTIGTVPGVLHGGEGGLLGLTVDSQNRLYAYSTGAGGNRIQRFAVTGTAGSLALGAPQSLLEGIPAAGNHNGGRLAFGPDGLLYATTGDAGQRSLAQNLHSLGGKILRMSPDGGVPPDNPFPGSYVYSYGHRNPQGLAWTEDGTLFATEFGQNTWDELNIITAGNNYGWPTVEGIARTEAFTDPVQQWRPEEASPSGIAYANGALYVANLRGEVLRRIPATDPTTAKDWFTGKYGRIRDSALAPDGSLWLLTNNTDGRGNPGQGDDRIIALNLNGASEK
ncbi:PQQ-dependent sugar dehydrogenase [Arthrobacter sp. lap29]|uniref:PQQ-dependent sugar dehydrogenase n=1 Tax=Arthrobacter sp. lap29 TaxID=3056122 RepID=UPI0028F7058B|nr:PQQ-dependent sugar dehydrogenase [Arthrobacter sp. lap29]